MSGSIEDSGFTNHKVHFEPQSLFIEFFSSNILELFVCEVSDKMEFEVLKDFQVIMIVISVQIRNCSMFIYTGSDSPSIRAAVSRFPFK